MKIENGTPPITRLLTGFYTFDRAFRNNRGDIGFPVGHGVEIFGGTNIGKSSLAYPLGGMIGKAQNKNIALCDLEGFDPEHARMMIEPTGFDGTLTVIRDKTHEKILDRANEFLQGDDYCVAIVDSVGAISPVAEQAGDLGDANMGKRAFAVAQLWRKFLVTLQAKAEDKDYRTVIMINHWYPRIGARGYDTPGGNVKDYLTSVQIHLKRTEEFDDGPDKTVGSYVLEGTVKKNRWGNYPDLKFQLFVVTGHGPHLGMSAMNDAVILGLATRSNGVIRIGDKSIGRLSKLLKSAKDGNDTEFEPFHEILGNNPNSGSGSNSSSESENSENSN